MKKMKIHFLLLFCCLGVIFFVSAVAIAYKWEKELQEKIDEKKVAKYSVHHGARLFH